MTSECGVLSYPIPIYQNLPIEAQFYKPSRFVISAIALGNTTTITTTTDMNYVIGQQVRLIIPQAFGCYQLNEAQGYVLSIPAANQVELSINTLVNVDAFFSANFHQILPQILAIGDILSGATNTDSLHLNTTIPGAFQNISPL